MCVKAAIKSRTWQQLQCQTHSTAGLLAKLFPSRRKQEAFVWVNIQTSSDLFSFLWVLWSYCWINWTVKISLQPWNASLKPKKAFTLKRRSIAWFNVGWLIVVGGSFLGCRAEQIRCRPILLLLPPSTWFRKSHCSRNAGHISESHQRHISSCWLPAVNKLGVSFSCAGFLFQVPL